MSDLVIRLERANVRLGGVRVLHDVEWEIKPGEHWVVTGANGSGKSTLLSLVRGEIWPEQGRGRRLYIDGGGASESPIGVRERIGMVSAELQDLYLRNEWEVSSLEVVVAGMRDGHLLYSPAGGEEIQAAMEALRTMGADHLAGRSFQRLSRGEGRRVILARALAAKPEILLLDECLDGLDRSVRADLAERLDGLAQARTRLVVSTHEPGRLPRCVTKALRMERGRAAVGNADAVTGQAPAALVCSASEACSGDGVTRQQAVVIFKLSGVTVRRRGREALRNVNWTMRKGEHWLITGRNGAGKSTLLSLLRGELHPMPGGVVERFGRGDEPMESFKLRMGWVSPELQARLDPDLAVAGTVLGGFFGSIGLHRDVEEGMEAEAEARLSAAGLGDLLRRRTGELSYGQLRRVLLVRAMINDPEVLLLDEPLAGLDQASRCAFRKDVEAAMAAGTQAVWATHDPEEPPAARWRRLRVEAGRLLEEESRSNVLA